MARVATLWTTTRAVAQPYLDAIENGLREHGWVAGRNLVLEHRFTDGKEAVLAAVAAEVLAWKPDVAVAPLNPAAQALKRLTGTVPIVFVVAQDPVGTGLAASLSHPGGNATGMTVAPPETAAKRLQMLHELAPGARRIGVIGNAGFPGYGSARKGIDDAASVLGLTLLDGVVRDADVFARTLDSLARERVDAVLVLGDNLTHLKRHDIVAAAQRNRWPAIYATREFCEAGGLACYGVDLPQRYRHSATYIDKILRGANPATLAIEVPTTFGLWLNRKTVKTLGIGVPASVQALGPELID